MNRACVSLACNPASPTVPLASLAAGWRPPTTAMLSSCSAWHAAWGSGAPAWSSSCTSTCPSSTQVRARCMGGQVGGWVGSSCWRCHMRGHNQVAGCVIPSASLVEKPYPPNRALRVLPLPVRGQRLPRLRPPLRGAHRAPAGRQRCAEWGVGGPCGWEGAVQT